MSIIYIMRHLHGYCSIFYLRTVYHVSSNLHQEPSSLGYTLHVLHSCFRRQFKQELTYEDPSDKRREAAKKYGGHLPMILSHPSKASCRIFHLFSLLLSKQHSSPVSCPHLRHREHDLPRKGREKEGQTVTPSPLTFPRLPHGLMLVPSALTCPTPPPSSPVPSLPYLPLPISCSRLGTVRLGEDGLHVLLLRNSSSLSCFSS